MTKIPFLILPQIIVNENSTLTPLSRDKLTALAKMIGSTVAKMHASGLIHGDITTSNILVINSDTGDDVSLVMIDFGLSYQEGSPEDKGVDLYVLERALLSTHPNTEWLFQVDLNVIGQESI